MKVPVASCETSLPWFFAIYIYKGLNYQVIQGLFHKQIKRIPIKQPRIQWNVNKGFDHCSVGSCACGSCVEQLDSLENQRLEFPTVEDLLDDHFSQINMKHPKTR